MIDYYDKLYLLVDTLNQQTKKMKKPIFPINLDRIREIEFILANAQKRYFTTKDQSDPPPLLGLCSITGQLPALAERLGVSSDELQTFVSLRDYCQYIAEGMLPNGFPTVVQLANELVIPEEQFSRWVAENVEAYQHQEERRCQKG